MNALERRARELARTGGRLEMVRALMDLARLDVGRLLAA